MRIPVIRGTIDRRILVNYRIAADALRRFLPAPFRPQLVNGIGIGGICLIRLNEVRPKMLPRFLGTSSENAAHRIAVEWDHAGELRTGVYIPRRDTSSRLNTLLGGRVFPGVHHHAKFTIDDRGSQYSIQMRSDDGEAQVAVAGRCCERFPANSVFESLEEASDFFECGSVGYSATTSGDKYDGLELRSFQWNVEPLAVERVESSLFDEGGAFPTGAAEFDSALLMRRIEHEWHGCDSLKVA